MDYIFIIGPSAVGKTTLAKGLYLHYHGVYIEQNMVPEFVIPDTVEDVGAFEEQLCWENTLRQIQFFHDRGFRHIVALDFDDIRARELPRIFRGSDFITLKLVSGDPDQIRRQMIHRNRNGGGLFAPERIERSNEVIKNRALLPNEVMIDVAGKTSEEVLAEAISIIDAFHPDRDYDDTLDDGHHYLSWVQSRQLF